MAAAARGFGMLNHPPMEQLLRHAPAQQPSTAEEAVQKSATNVSARGGAGLQQLLSQTTRCILKPHAFFVSWQGVITLAYRGFPPALVQLKRALDEMHPGLPKENPGSKWPKTSLGAVQDRKRLTPQQLETLLRICREETDILRMDSTVANGVVVDRAAIVLFECRSLEKAISWQEVAFSGETDMAEPEPEEEQRVSRIMSESEDPDYWFAASKDGNRAGHYREPHLGATLAHGLPLEDSSRSAAAQLRLLINKFRARVDKELPGVYAWFADSSLHITLRAIMG